jgi:hypothetical protein
VWDVRVGFQLLNSSTLKKSYELGNLKNHRERLLFFLKIMLDNLEHVHQEYVCSNPERILLGCQRICETIEHIHFFFFIYEHFSLVRWSYEL